MTARIDVEEVRAALTRDAVVGRFGLRVYGLPGSRWLRVRECPACGHVFRRLAGAGVCIGVRGWHCLRCEASGDLLDLVARLSNHDIKREFPAVLQLGADLAGVVAIEDPRERERRRRQLERQAAARRAADERAELEGRDEARASASRTWAGLLPHHDRGADYLAGRGLDAALLERRGVVRYTDAGEPSVALRDRHGQVWNVLRRRFGDVDPKVMGLRGGKAAGTLAGTLDDIIGGRDVIVPEGAMDTLTAVQAWPDATVLGANGAGQVANVVRGAAPRVRLAGGRLVLVVDPDAPGRRAAVEAAKVAISAGLVLDASLRIVEFKDQDLNKAWCAGWRP